MNRILSCAACLPALVALNTVFCFAQPETSIDTFFRRNIGLTDDEIAAIRNGQPVAKSLPPRKPAEVFLFGAVYIHADPASYFQYVRDLKRLRQLPAYLALGVNNNPPQLSDWDGFSFDDDDIQSLKECRPGDCKIQMPAGSIQEVQRTIDWSAPDVADRVNQLLDKSAYEFLLAYEREGNHAFGVFNDKNEPIDVAHEFAYLLSYSEAFPEYLPDFYHYLLAYPKEKPANVHDAFYWARVKFDLKPTLRMVHVAIMRGDPADRVAYAVAEKQLYASHYFETALDLSFCLPDTASTKGPGFYLIMALGSEQAGFTGPKGSIVRKAAVGRSVSGLRNALARIQNTLEKTQ